MPISQKTILAIYGLFLDLDQAIIDAVDAAEAPQLFAGGTATQDDPLAALARLRVRSHHFQLEAVQLIMQDDPATPINPITGRIG